MGPLWVSDTLFGVHALGLLFGVHALASYGCPFSSACKARLRLGLLVGVHALAS